MLLVAFVVFALTPRLPSPNHDPHPTTLTPIPTPSTVPQSIYLDHCELVLPPDEFEFLRSQAQRSDGFVIRFDPGDEVHITWGSSRKLLDQAHDLLKVEGG